MDYGIICQSPKVILLLFSGIFIYFSVDRSLTGGLNDGNSQFERPHDIEFDSSGNSYVIDRDLYNVQKFTHDGLKALFSDVVLVELQI
jgi:hypothetical protein